MIFLYCILNEFTSLHFLPLVLMGRLSSYLLSLLSACNLTQYGMYVASRSLLLDYHIRVQKGTSLLLSLFPSSISTRKIFPVHMCTQSRKQTLVVPSEMDSNATRVIDRKQKIFFVSFRSYGLWGVPILLCGKSTGK